MEQIAVLLVWASFLKWEAIRNEDNGKLGISLLQDLVSFGCVVWAAFIAF